MRSVVLRSTTPAVIYAALGSVVLSPLCNFNELGSALYLGDVRLIAWTLAWNNHAMLDGVPSYWDANIFYPATQTLALSEHLFGISLFSLPVYAATRNPALSYNVVWLFSFPASAVAAHWLAWRYTRDHLAAMLAGVIYAFCFFKILHGGGHLQIVWSFWLPVAMLLLAWWFERPRWGTAVALAAVITLQVLSSWYVGVMTVLAVAVFGVWQTVSLLVLLRARARCGARSTPPDMLVTVVAPVAPGRRALQLALIAAFCATAISPFAKPYLRGTLDSAPQEVRENSARISDYLLPPAHTWGGHVAAAAGAYGLNPPYGERAIFVGYVALAASIVAIGVLAGSRRRDGAAIGGSPPERAEPADVRREDAPPRADAEAGAALRMQTIPNVTEGAVGLTTQRPELWCLVALAALAFACSLGPAAVGRGASSAAASGVMDWTAFGLISHLPGLSLFRAPARFALLVMLALSVLAAFAARWWQDRLGLTGRILTVLLVPVAVSESFMIGGSPVGRPQPVEIPPIYRQLATVPPGPVVSLPGYREPRLWWRRADFQYFSTVHWFPIVNGYSRVDPPDHGWIMGHMTAFPGVNSANTMRRLGVRYVVLHADRHPDGAAEILELARSSPDFTLRSRIGEAYLFEVSKNDR